MRVCRRTMILSVCCMAMHAILLVQYDFWCRGALQEKQDSIFSHNQKVISLIQGDGTTKPGDEMAGGEVTTKPRSKPAANLTEILLYPQRIFEWPASDENLAREFECRWCWPDEKLHLALPSLRRRQSTTAGIPGVVDCLQRRLALPSCAPSSLASVTYNVSHQ